MRRRTLLGGSNVDYVFSAQSTSVSIDYYSSSTNVSIKSTADGTNIGYSVVDYDRTVVTGVTTAATRVTIRYSANPTYGQRNGSVVLKQNDSNNTITINVSQNAQPFELGYTGILLDGTSGSNGSIPFDDSVTFSNVPSWADVTYSSGRINATASSTNSASAVRLGTITVSLGSHSTELTIIQLQSDYHSRDYVTMGSRNWSIKNVGANSVQDYGNYYQYGYGSQQYAATSGQSNYSGTENPLASSADTATQVMGEGWRMPTRSELSNLRSNSYYSAYYNGVNGGVFYSRVSGNVLFIPFAGIYSGGSIGQEGSNGRVWSSTPINNSDSYGMYFNRYGNDVNSYGRYQGFSVRGVRA